jgi:hypothetical protein
MFGPLNFNISGVSCIQNMPENDLSSTTSNFFEKCPNTSKKLHTNLQYVHNNCAKFEECQPRGMRGVDLHKCFEKSA